MCNRISPLLALTIVGVMLSGSVARTEEPQYTRVPSAYQDCRFDEAALLQHDFATLLAQNVPFTLHRAPRATELALLDIRPADPTILLGKPTVFYVRTAGGVRAVLPGQTVDGAELAGPWVLISYAGDANAPFDVPTLLVLGRRPARIAWRGQEAIVATYAQPDTGWVARMPLYGSYKPRQQSRPDWLKDNGLPDIDPHTWTWRDRFPDEVATRCDWWSRVCRAFPVGYRESFSVDRGKDTVTTRQDYQWLLVQDDWRTQPLRLAMIPPLLGLTQLYKGFPVTFSAPIHDPNYVTTYGPFMGALDVDRLEYTIHVGQYINTVLELDKTKLTTPTDAKALANIQKLMAEKFPSPDRWSHDHMGDLFLWAFHSDNWYARAIPLVDDALAERARKSFGLYLDQFAIVPGISGWVSHRGRWMISGPGSAAWGDFGDQGKLGDTTLLTVWAYAQFSGDWDLIKRHWDFIKRMHNADLVSDDWLTYCRDGHAEWGDIGAPTIALARMAWGVGDYDTYLYASFVASRQLVGHFATMQGAEYFRRNGPHVSDEPMPATVFMSHQHRGAGWFVNGPTFKPKSDTDPVYQWVCRFARFACPDVGRFYQDTVDQTMRDRLASPDIYTGRWLEHMTQHESHLDPSMVRLWALATNAPQEEVAAKGPWEQWNQRGSWEVAGNYSVLLADRNAHKLTRVVPAGEPSEFVAGLERFTQGWEPSFGAVEQWKPNFRPQWYKCFFAGRIRAGMEFGATAPVAAQGTTTYQGSQLLHWAGVAWWTDYVPARQLDAATVRRLNGQFNSPWLVCGPFSNGIDDGIETVYGPETDLATAQYPGLEGPVSWREAAPRDGMIDSAAAFGGRDRIGYQLQWVFSPTERKALLAVGYTGGCKAWLAGRLVFYTHMRHGRNPSVAYVPVTLPAGWSPVLMKTEWMSGRTWQTSAQVLGPDKLPLEDLQYATRKP